MYLVLGQTKILATRTYCLFYATEVQDLFNNIFDPWSAFMLKVRLGVVGLGVHSGYVNF